VERRIRRSLKTEMSGWHASGARNCVFGSLLRSSPPLTSSTLQTFFLLGAGALFFFVQLTRPLREMTLSVVSAASASFATWAASSASKASTASFSFLAFFSLLLFLKTRALASLKLPMGVSSSLSMPIQLSYLAANPLNDNFKPPKGSSWRPL